MNQPSATEPRPRAPWWKRLLRRVALLLFVLLLVYAVLAVRFNLRSASVTTDHYAELNAAVPQPPPGPRPHEVYAQIKAAWDAAVAEAEGAILSRSAGAADNRDPFASGASHPPVFKAFPSLDPEHPDYDVAIATLRAFLPTLEPAYGAAALPHPGSLLRPRTGVAGPLATSLLVFELPDYGGARAVARLMAADHNLASDEGDSDRALRSLLGLYDLTAQTGRQPLLISALVHLAIGHVADGALLETLTDHPGLFSPAQLSQIADAIPAPAPDEFDFAIQTERRVTADLVQRMFTDDGRGGGKVTPVGVAFLLRGGPLGPGRSGPGIGSRLVGPLVSPFLADRRELNEAVEREFEDALAASHDTARLGDLYDGMLSKPYPTKREQLRMLRFLDVMPVLTKSVASSHRARTVRGSVLVLLAAHRYRLDHGSFPESIDPLVPDYLSALPPDPFAPGSPLRYLKSGDGVTIYSVGTDGEDNGGTVYADGRTDDPVRDFERFASGTPRVDAEGIDWVLLPEWTQPEDE